MPLSAEFYRSRRRQLMELVGDGNAALIAAASEKLRSNDVEYRFRQNSDFDYLTGFPEPDALCLLLPGHPKHEYVLFVRPRDAERETWTGRRAGEEGAQRVYGADAAFPIDRLDELVPQLLGDCDAVFFSMDRRAAYNQRILDWLETLQSGRQRSGSAPGEQHDLRALLHEMRLFKSPEEVAAMRAAATLSCEAHQRILTTARPGQREYEIEAELEYAFRMGGASGPAYPSIVAGGINATILHYTENCCVLEDGDLLLVDAGAELDGYCGDVTRTFPVGARFEGRQRDIYELVLKAQLAAVEAVAPGRAFDDVHDVALQILIEGLVELRIVEGSADQVLEQQLYRPYYMHRTSHWLGRDVHDVGLYRDGEGSRLLEPGMVLTVEPGLYFGEHGDAEKWRGIGVRIEDDVLVTEEGAEVLTGALAKSLAEVEALRGEAR